MINKIATTLFILLIIFAGFYIYQNEFASCKNPIFYDIGGFDNRFGISKDKFLTTIKEAETVWESKIDRNIFEYKPLSKFKINLVFDERQKSTIEASESKEGIEGSRSQYDSLVADYKALAASYEGDLRRYNNNVYVFEARLKEYNDYVAEINGRGGATPPEHKELEQERKELEEQKAILDNQRLILNGRASELNSLGDTVNAIAGDLNIDVDIHNQRFGEAREFDQGEYSGDQINIYQFETVGDLRLVLAHELGHALGIDHVENPVSVMYHLMDKQNIQNPFLSPEDISALDYRCNF